MAGDTTIDLSKVCSILCVPADNEERVRKARDRGADLVLFDLEDGVDPARRHIAREILGRYIGPDVAVRLNRVGTSDYFNDRTLAFRAGLVFLPKAEIEHCGAFSQSTVLCIESPRAVRQLLRALPDVAGLAFGRADYTAVVQGAVELVDHAALEITSAAHAFGIHVSDAPCYVLDEPGTLIEETARSRRQGFHSKGCFHPSQIATVNAGMRPSLAEVEAARATLAARTSGIKRTSVGVISPPVLALAERIVNR